MLDVLILAGFLFSASVLYFCALKLIDRIDPFGNENVSKEQADFHIAVSDLVFLREISPFLESGSCEFYTGSTSEILNHNGVTKMDALIVPDDIDDQKQLIMMSRIKGRYYSSSLSLKTQNTDLQLLTQKPHTVTIYYQQSFADIINTLITQGILAPVNER